MPSLGSVASALGSPFRVKHAGTVRGVLRAPPESGAALNPTFPPRRILTVSRKESLAAGNVITDLTGNQFLVGSWAEDIAFGGAIGRSFVLFEVTKTVAWQRQTFTVEPISGQRIAGGLATLGEIEVVSEPLRELTGTVGTTRVFRCLTAAPIEVGDIVGGQKIFHVEQTLGLTYGQAN
jgi:hypothetical protein